MTETPYALSVAAIFRDEAPYLREWIAYHLLVGVEHFWLYDDSSADDWRDVLARYLDSGVVEVTDWPVPSQRDLIDFQVNAYRDALRRARGRTEWLALIDVDEFVVPVQEETVTECLAKHFADASAVYVNWRNFGTGGVHLNESEPLLAGLTACAPDDHPSNAVGKTIVRPDRTVAANLWSGHHCILEPGAAYYDGDGEPLGVSDVEPQLDGRVHGRFLRINHYQMRDETFFRAARLPRAQAPGGEEWLVWEHYYAYSAERNADVVELLRRSHPAAYDELWAGSREAPPPRPYVTAQIQGRLGNILFQVAAASAVAWANGAEPRFPDLEYSSPWSRHVFFRCNLTPEAVEPAFEWHEPSYAYTPIPFRPNMRIFGYFQSERHFARHRQRLLELLSPGEQDLAYIANAYGSILDHPRTVAVQIRHYRPEDPTGAIYPKYGLDYLEQAAAFFPEDALFVVGSDDPAYARASLPSRMRNVVVLDGEPDYIDLFLLSSCRDAIISNSSFGWWAAWLNRNDDKRVVRPKLWIKGHPSDDVCPEEWIAVDAPES
jgi:Glycosyltransferase family 92/Glycosyl transferase family 11